MYENQGASEEINELGMLYFNLRVFLFFIYIKIITIIIIIRGANYF